MPGPLTPVCYGGNFAAKASQIYSKKKLWERMATSLSRGDSIEEGHFAERAWAGILSYPLNSNETAIMQRWEKLSNATSIPASCYTLLTHHSQLLSAHTLLCIHSIPMIYGPPGGGYIGTVHLNEWLTFLAFLFSSSFLLFLRFDVTCIFIILSNIVFFVKSIVSNINVFLFCFVLVLVTCHMLQSVFSVSLI